MYGAGAGVHVQVKAAGADGEPDSAGPSVQLPRARHVAIGTDVTASSARVQSAFDAAQAYTPEPD